MHADNAPSSYLEWLFLTLGPWTSVWMFSAAVVGFALTVVLLIRGRGAAAAAVILAMVPLPLLIGVFVMARKIIAAFAILAMSDVDLPAREIAAVWSESMVPIQLGFFASIPTFVLAVGGLTGRALRGTEQINGSL